MKFFVQKNLYTFFVSIITVYYGHILIFLEAIRIK